MTVRNATMAAVATAVLAVGLAVGLVGCGGPAQPSASPSASQSSGSQQGVSPSSKDTPTPVQPTQDEVGLTLTSQGGTITPNAEKIDVPVGSTVVLTVTSDVDDEIHAHTGGDGYELEVKAGVPATGRFTVDQPGSFEIESHHLNKVFAILNVR